MPECYVTKMEYQLKLDKPIAKGGWRTGGRKWQLFPLYTF